MRQLDDRRTVRENSAKKLIQCALLEWLCSYGAIGHLTGRLVDGIAVGRLLIDSGGTPLPNGYTA